MLKYIFAFSLLCVPAFLFAQNTKISLNFSTNYFWLELDPPRSNTLLYGRENAYHTFGGGISLEFQNDSKLSFVADASFINKRIDEVDPGGVGFTFNYVALTPKIQYQIVKGLYLNSGLSLQYLLHKKASNFFDNTNTNEDTHFANHNIDFVGGFQIKIKQAYIFSQFNFGLTKNLRKVLVEIPITYDDVMVKSRMVLFGVGYTLD